MRHRKNSLEDPESMFKNSSIQNTNIQFNKVSEIPQLTRHEINKRIRQERLFDFAQRNGIDCLAYCEPEEEDSALFQEINFNKLQDYEPWYENLKGTELKKLFS